VKKDFGEKTINAIIHGIGNDKLT